MASSNEGFIALLSFKPWGNDTNQFIKDGQ